MIIGNVLLFVMSLIAMLWLSPVLTLIAVAIAPVLWIIAYRSRRDLFPANWAAQHEEGEGGQRRRGRHHRRTRGERLRPGGARAQTAGGRARQLFGARMRSVKLTARYAPALQAVAGDRPGGRAGARRILALQGQVTLGTFLAFTTYLGQFVGPVRFVRHAAHHRTAGQGQHRTGHEVIDTRPTLTEAPDAVALPPARSPSSWMTCGSGTTTPAGAGRGLADHPPARRRLVGTAGSGKSTVAQLLPGFYERTWRRHSGRRDWTYGPAP